MHQLNLNQQKPKPVITNASPPRTPFSKTDRISTLPDEILHFIMTFLSTKIAARTSVLSKRFNSLWWSFPIIDLNELDIGTYDVIDNNQDGPGKKFLDHMKLCYIRHDLKFVEKLRIIPNEKINAGNENLSPVIDSFVLAGIEGKALKEIELQFLTFIEPPFNGQSVLASYYGSFYKLSYMPLFASSKFLKTLKLKGCALGESFGTTVPHIELPCVEEISIQDCITPYNFVSKLVDGCPKLEDLSVKFCLGVVVITCSHSKLKNLILRCHDSEMELQMDVPNLQTFKYGGAYWQWPDVHGLEESDEYEVRLKKEHIINAPNLEFFCVKYAYVLRNTIQMALTRFKNLKEMVLNHCCMDVGPEFKGKKIERLVISNCEFGEGGLVFYESSLPVLRSLEIYSCNGLQWLNIASTKLEEMVLEEITGLVAWNIWAPNVSSDRCVVDFAY